MFSPFVEQIHDVHPGSVARFRLEERLKIDFVLERSFFFSEWNSVRICLQSAGSNKTASPGAGLGGVPAQGLFFSAGWFCFWGTAINQHNVNVSWPCPPAFKSKNNFGSLQNFPLNGSICLLNNVLSQTMKYHFARHCSCMCSWVLIYFFFVCVHVRISEKSLFLANRLFLCFCL